MPVMIPGIWHIDVVYYLNVSEDVRPYKYTKDLGTTCGCAPRAV
jgi:hypothetical protein